MQRTIRVVQCALSAALLAVCAWIAVPAGIPFTLQTLGVYLILLLFGGRQGLVTVAVYLLLGAVGLPVFAGGTGGLSVLFGVTGGFLWGFLLAAVIYALCERWRVAALVVGQLLGYVFGCVWFSVLSGDRLGVALLTCVLPFVLPDAAKMAVALWVAPHLKKAIKI